MFPFLFIFREKHLNIKPRRLRPRTFGSPTGRTAVYELDIFLTFGYYAKHENVQSPKRTPANPCRSSQSPGPSHSAFYTGRTGLGPALRLRAYGNGGSRHLDCFQASSRIEKRRIGGERKKGETGLVPLAHALRPEFPLLCGNRLETASARYEKSSAMT